MKFSVLQKTTYTE